MCKSCSSMQILREIALFPRKIYTAGTNFTRPLVVTVATNLNSGRWWLFDAPPFMPTVICRKPQLYVNLCQKSWALEGKRRQESRWRSCFFIYFIYLKRWKSFFLSIWSISKGGGVVFLCISSVWKGGKVVFFYLFDLFQKVEELPEPDSVMACSQASDK